MFRAAQWYVIALTVIRSNVRLKAQKHIDLTKELER